MRPTIRLCWPTLLLTLVVLLIFLIPFPTARAKPKLTAGTDLFWETYEQRFGCSPCPDEDTATARLRAMGYDVEP